jgi:hypothetical protein
MFEGEKLKNLSESFQYIRYVAKKENFHCPDCEKFQATTNTEFAIRAWPFLPQNLFVT